MNERSDGVVTLTLFVPNDAAVLCDGDTDPELRRRFDFPDDFTPSLTHSVEVIARWQAERAAGRRFPYAIRSAATNELLGGCELRPLGLGSANVSYWTYPAHRRRGVATRALRLACEIAFPEFGFRTLEALIEPDNAASRKAAHANGFVEVGQRDGRLLYLRENVENVPIRVLIFGATGMVGQGVLRECLLDPEVALVVAVGRSATGRTDPKLREILAPDLFDLSPFESQLSGFDACFFTLGVSSAGMSEADYTHTTFDLTLGIARPLAQLNPQMMFIYVSGAGTGGNSMWARVKGRTENALLALPFKGAYMFRPALIQPMHGIKLKTRSYRLFYAILWPVMPVLRRLLPGYVTTTERIGRAMLAVAKDGYPKQILETRDINGLGHPSS